MYVDSDGMDGKIVDLGKGWYYRIDRADSNTKTQRHIHIYNSKKSYAQNEDGSPHDKNNNNSGTPPKRILNKVKEQANWDYKKKENDFFSKTDIKYMEGCAIITYADNRQIIKQFSWYEVGRVTKGMAKQYYYNYVPNTQTKNTSIYITPILPSVTVPSVAPGFMPAFGF